MIDTHVHVVPPRLPGVGLLHPLLDRGPEMAAAALQREMASAGVTDALAMGCLSDVPDDPLGVASTLAVARFLPGLHAVGIMNPVRGGDREHIRRADAAVAPGRVRALKGYLGYLHYGPEHEGYRPYYELAERHQLPVIFHTGDTYSPRAKLRFALPLLVDEVAVDHPNVNFVLAHLGNPWLTEAAEVVYKNVNVWADLSGLAVGSLADFSTPERQETLQDAQTALRRAFRYAERPNRFLYGSDWPLAPMPAYRDFVAAALPEMYHPLVFEDNARALFQL
jgi:predicted TIM-barrel fold metal-dependent hydrolase